jgi:hypothetical protein
MTRAELRHMFQALETDLDSMRNLKASLENSLRDEDTRYAMQVEQLNAVLLHLERGSTTARSMGSCKTSRSSSRLRSPPTVAYWKMGRTSVSMMSKTAAAAAPCKPSTRPPPAGLWRAKWYLRSMTSKC